MRLLFVIVKRNTTEEYRQETVQKCLVSDPRLSGWMEENLAGRFTVFAFPLEYLCMIRTTNSLESINKKIRRRTRIVGVFPYEISCLKWILTLLMGIGEEWHIRESYCPTKSLEC